jgi:plasmid stability protein
MSVSLTLSNLDDETFRRLQAEAQRRGVDVESAAKSVLASHLPAKPAERNERSNGPPYHDLDFLAGTWTDEEAQEFLDAIADCGRVDPEMWQ